MSEIVIPFPLGLRKSTLVILSIETINTLIVNMDIFPSFSIVVVFIMKYTATVETKLLIEPERVSVSVRICQVKVWRSALYDTASHK